MLNYTPYPNHNVLQITDESDIAWLEAIDEIDPGGYPDHSSLNEQQAIAYDTIISFICSSYDKFFRLSGYSGTGKSYLIVQVLKWLIWQRMSVLAAAPTNKAVQNLNHLAQEHDVDSAYLDFMTVARLLGKVVEVDESSGNENYVSAKPVDLSKTDIIIIDEFSMVGKNDFAEITRAVRDYPRLKVIFVGDSAQLNPVGELTSQASTSPLIKDSAELTEVVRYSGELARVAQEIRTRNRYQKFLYNFSQSEDGTIEVLDDKETWLDRAADLFDADEQIKLLAWRNKTVESLNHSIRERIWSDAEQPYYVGEKLITKRPLFRAGKNGYYKDKWRVFVPTSEELEVIAPYSLLQYQVKRTVYDYYRLTVCSANMPSFTVDILSKDCKDKYNRQLQYLKREAVKAKGKSRGEKWSAYYELRNRFDSITYSYALTVHRAQGSTINHVFLDHYDFALSSEKQRLSYTALTRTKERVYLYE